MEANKPEGCRSGRRRRRISATAAAAAAAASIGLSINEIDAA